MGKSDILFDLGQEVEVNLSKEVGKICLIQVSSKGVKYRVNLGHGDRPYFWQSELNGHSQKDRVLVHQDGTVEEYDDTYDVILHCTSQDEHDGLVKGLIRVGAISGETFKVVDKEGH